MRLLLPVVALALAALCSNIGACGAQEEAPPAPRTAAAAPSATTLDLRISPIIDLHFLVRLAIDEATAAPKLAGFEQAIAAAQQLQASLGGPRGWLRFEGNFLDCQTAADVEACFEKLPETIQSPGGESPFREPALAYSRALTQIEPRFLEEVWPDHRARIERQHKAITETYSRHDRACLDFMIASLGMSDPQIKAPVYLFAFGPYPGASTSRTHEGEAVCFIGVASIGSDGGSLLYEAILHEVIHALDVATTDQPGTAFNLIRERLKQAGLEPRDRLVHDAWHTIMFIQAGETVRRLVEPSHVHYGDAEGVYERLKGIAEIERPLWIAYLDGKLGLEPTIKVICAKLTGGGAATKPGAVP